MMYGSFGHYFGSPLLTGGFGFFILTAALWDLAWKGLGLWRAAQRNETGWFVAILVLNTLGILPILYLYVFSRPESKK